MTMMWSRWRPGRRQPTAGMKAMKERSRNRSTVGPGRWIVGALPVIERLGGVRAARISPGARSVGWVGQLKRWATVWSVERQLGRWSHRPSLLNDGGTGASSNGRNEAGRGRCDITVVVIVGVGNWRGGGCPLAPCWAPGTRRSPISFGLGGGVWPKDRLPLPARHRRWGWGRWGRHL